ASCAPPPRTAPAARTECPAGDRPPLAPRPAPSPTATAEGSAGSSPKSPPPATRSTRRSWPVPELPESSPPAPIRGLQTPWPPPGHEVSPPSKAVTSLATNCGQIMNSLQTAVACLTLPGIGRIEPVSSHVDRRTLARGVPMPVRRIGPTLVFVLSLGLILLFQSTLFGPGSAAWAQICDPVGSPPRFGCQWSLTLCDWVCPICDPYGPAPRSSCTWDMNLCNWVCNGYTGTEVTVSTTKGPTQDATVYLR